MSYAPTRIKSCINIIWVPYIGIFLFLLVGNLLTPYLAFRGVALAEVSAWIGAWIMLMITYWIYQERTDSFR